MTTDSRGEMKRELVAAVALILATASPAARAANTVAVRFTPGDIISHEIDARRQVLVQTNSFTSAPIADALVNAKKRGVDVLLAVLDRRQRMERYTGAIFPANGGVPVLIDAATPSPTTRS